MFRAYFFSVMLTLPALAQLSVGPWTIAETPAGSYGAVVACATNAPAVVPGNCVTLHSISHVVGNTASAAGSSCIRFLTATSTITIGPAATDVFVDAALAGYLEQQAPGGGNCLVAAHVAVDGNTILNLNPLAPNQTAPPAPMFVASAASTTICLGPGPHTVVVTLNTYAQNYSADPSLDTISDFLTLVPAGLRGFTVCLYDHGPCATAPTILNNGPLVTSAGAGFGGADVSALVAPLNVFGFTGSPVYRLADDFTVPCGESWSVGSITTYGYQTQPAGGPFTTVSTLTGGNYRIWSQPPNAAGIGILHDYSAANQMSTTGFSNVYRTTAAAPLSQDRPIFTMVMAGNGIVLGPGNYWLDFQITGTGAAPVFAPPITISGQLSTGNGIQWLGTAWSGMLSSAGFAQGLPFLIGGSIAPVPCFALNITQPGGPGTLLYLVDSGGTSGNTFLNLITLNVGSFPNGWLFGLDLTLAEAVGLINSGLPFTGTLDALGGYSLVLPVSLPFPLPVQYVGLELSGATLIRADDPKSVVIN